MPVSTLGWLNFAVPNLGGADLAAPTLRLPALTGAALAGATLDRGGLIALVLLASFLDVDSEDFPGVAGAFFLGDADLRDATAMG